MVRGLLWLCRKPKPDMNLNTSGWLVLTRNFVVGSHLQNDTHPVLVVQHAIGPLAELGGQHRRTRGLLLPRLLSGQVAV